MKLFVGNISKSVKADALRALFEELGEVASVVILTDKYTGESKGFGFVEMPNDQQASQAIRKFSNAEFFDRKLVVSKARPKTSTY